jgi:class 3 adenylate cyclase
VGKIDMAEERVERRLSAILAADIAGYSALMGADEARTVRDLKAHQAFILPMVSEFGGRVIDTAGDGIPQRRPAADTAFLGLLSIGGNLDKYSSWIGTRVNPKAVGLSADRSS